MSKTVLIVEDDLAIAESLAMLLGAHGYKALTATDSHGAFEQIRVQLPDAIVLDYDLPGDNGDAITQKLKQQEGTGHIGIIVISASQYARDICLNAGADKFIEKPYEIDALLAAVSEMMQP
jgi:DNA-binding response OmpR family regulator